VGARCQLWREQPKAANPAKNANEAALGIFAFCWETVEGRPKNAKTDTPPGSKMMNDVKRRDQETGLLARVP
jgi:hypothetical protein